MKREVVDLSEEQIGEIYESLAAFDRKNIGYRLDGSVNIGIEADGRLIAGLNGCITAYKIFYIDTVFVEEEYRRQGVGTKLLKEAEKRAEALGANMIRLDTFNWQGREFYGKLGYEEVGAYSNPEDGFSEHFFVKRLTPQTASNTLQADGSGHRSTKCLFCKETMKQDRTAYFAQLENSFVIIKNVPCFKCSQCGEIVYSAYVTHRLDEIVAEFGRSVTEIAVVNYSAT